uniref:ATP-binding cassette domain-containing protein n=1 Tax=Adlercreutzia sp. TaxID=1872387 RepID=UPI003A95B345
MTKNAVELRSVSFTYAGFDAPAVDDVSFAVAPGECIVLCGESGCGKTTATRIVNGLAGGFYEGSRTGKVLIAGRDVDGLEDWELSSLTGSVFQNPRTQFFNLDTTGEIAFGMENLGVPREEMHRRVRDVVRELGIECLMGRGIFELSGGQMQSVAFASAWACKPSVYVLDEPSSNLDPPSMEKLASFISKAKSSGSAVIIAEHRLSYLASVADRYLLFEGGSVAAEWDAQRFLGLSDAERESCGLRSSEPPKLADLMQRLSRPVSAFPAVEARGIYAGYEKGVPVLEGITVSFDPGRVVGVVGRNGAGKSTLLKCLAGIKKEELGHVRFQGS